MSMTLTLVFILCAIHVVCCYPTAFQDLGESKNRTSIKFLAIGDWGGLPYPPYITAVQKATAQEMSKVAEQMGADFVLALGDNFYYKGVNSVDSPRFKDTFESVYTAKSLKIPCKLPSKRSSDDYISDLKFPAYYYELNFHIPNTQKILTIIMLDTVLLCGNSDDFLDGQPKGPLLTAEANRQLVWLQDRMARSRADFLLVAGHYPVWSVSEHGPTQCLLQKLHPLLNKYKATAYLCGHDHNLQYIEESGVGYVVSGAGNFLDPDVRHWKQVPEGSVKFFTGQASTLGGFIHAEVTKNKMIVTFYQAKGTSLYRTVLSQRNMEE
uniref:Tartrate-resistant acid phosphatase type 5 n=1 Tax=Sphaeramia orbicularis TaxID=375764 RepID=A0A672Y5V9_9TELE